MKDYKDIKKLILRLIKKTNKILAHLEVGWDDYEEKTLISKYKNRSLILKDIEIRDRDIYK